MLGFLGIALALLGVLISVQVVSAHDFSPKFRWYNSTVTVKDLTDNYSAQVGTAIFEYDNYTDMDWSASSTGTLTFYEMNIGYVVWIGAGIAERPSNEGWVACSSYPDLSITGECDHLNHKARRGHVYLNTKYQWDLDLLIDTLVLHEPGHVIGMAHSDCTDDSVMNRYGCGNLPILLKFHDKTHINEWY